MCWADSDFSFRTSCTCTQFVQESRVTGKVASVRVPEKLLQVSMWGACISRILVGIVCFEQISKEPLPCV